jgi:multisubunit Na+/H+ antiporter MnhC subunit
MLSTQVALGRPLSPSLRNLDCGPPISFFVALGGVIVPLAAGVALGIGMSGCGGIDIVVASIALQGGLFNQGQDSPYVEHLFSALVVTAVVVTVTVPLLLRLVVPAGRQSDAEP